MYLTEAKFKSNCVELGKPIKKGDSILYDKYNKVVYSKDSKKYQQYLIDTSSKGSFNIDTMLETQAEYFCPSENY